MTGAPGFKMGHVTLIMPM